MALEQAKTKLSDTLVTFGKNYLGVMITSTLKPVFKDALLSLLDDTKKEVGMKAEVKEDKLGDQKGAEEGDLFGMALDSCRKVETSWSYSFTAYSLYAIRVGYNKGGDFYALGAKYEVRYDVLRCMHDKVAKENPKEVLPPLPPACLHGTYCCCLTRKSDLAGSEAAMRGYLSEFAKAHRTSAALADHFYLGEKYDVQQRAFAVFQEAYQQTQDELVKGEFIRDLPPFNEGEALKALLLAVARQEVIPLIKSMFEPPIPQMANRMERSMNGTVITMVDACMVAWPVAQEVADKAKVKVQELIDSGAEKLVEALKPVLKKVLELVQSKLAKKDDGKEEKLEEKKKKTEIGDYLSQWRFEKTEIGKKLYDALATGSNAKGALHALEDDFDKAVSSTLEAKMKDGVAHIIGDRNAGLEVVSLVLEHVAKQAIGVLKRFTTIKPLMAAAGGVFEAYNTLCTKITPGQSADDVAKNLDACSKEMWGSFPDAGLLLFSKMDALKAHIASEFSSVPEDAIKPLTDCADELYTQQMKALNMLRNQFIKTCRAKLTGDALKSQDSINEVIRPAFRDTVFSIIHILAIDSWKKVAANLIKSAIIQVQKKFEETVWKPIAEGLSAIQSLIPEQLASIGLQIEPMAKAVANIILEKGTKWALNKLIIKLELALFEQAGTVLNM
jgi:hypothetical protein